MISEWQNTAVGEALGLDVVLTTARPENATRPRL